MESLSREAHYQLMKGWLNERQYALHSSARLPPIQATSPMPSGTVSNNSCRPDHRVADSAATASARSSMRSFICYAPAAAFCYLTTVRTTGESQPPVGLAGISSPMSTIAHVFSLLCYLLVGGTRAPRRADNSTVRGPALTRAQRARQAVCCQTWWGTAQRRPGSESR